MNFFQISRQRLLGTAHSPSKYLPAEPAFPCGDDNNSNSKSNTTLADLDWGFSRPAAVRGPGSADLAWGFSRPAAVRPGRRPGSADLDWGFSGISVGTP